MRDGAGSPRRYGVESLKPCGRRDRPPSRGRRVGCVNPFPIAGDYTKHACERVSAAPGSLGAAHQHFRAVAHFVPPGSGPRRLDILITA
eukprot:5189991-Prymnesium_polylepis.2